MQGHTRQYRTSASLGVGEHSLICNIGPSFSIKSQIVSLWGFAGNGVSSATIPACGYTMKYSVDDTGMSGGGSIPMKHFLWTIKSESLIFKCHNILFF